MRTSCDNTKCSCYISGMCVIEFDKCAERIETIKAITPSEFAEKMDEIYNAEEIVEGHERADKLMCEILEVLGYGKGIEIFRKMYKYYA